MAYEVGRYYRTPDGSCYQYGGVQVLGGPATAVPAMTPVFDDCVECSAFVPTANRHACTHRGDHIDEVECKTCSGHVRLKVFACDRHGQCTIGKVSNGIACCETCSDYESAGR